MLKSVPPLVSVSTRNGLIAGILGFAFLIALYSMGRHPFLFAVYVDFRIVLFVVFMVMGLRELRNDQRGELSFGQGMVSNFLFTAVFATLVGTLIRIYCMLAPGFLSSYIQTAADQIKSIGPVVIEQLGKDAYDRNLAALAATNGGDLALDYFVKSFIISFFISIIISVILRRQPKTN